MELSTAGLIGAAAALAVGLLNYRLVVPVLEQRLRALDRSTTPEQKLEFERKILLMGRIVLWTDVVVFPVIGYTLGKTIWG